MTYTSETELLLSQIDLHQLEESSVRSHQTEIAEHVKPEFKLVIDDGSNYRSYILTGDYYDIGRDLSCSITVSNQYISGHHATLRRVYDSSLASGLPINFLMDRLRENPVRTVCLLMRIKSGNRVSSQVMLSSLGLRSKPSLVKSP